MRLQGKVALISGGARGMGAVEARLFVKEGAKVAIADVLQDEGNSLEAEISNAGGDAFFVNLDVTSEDAWSRAIAEVVAKYGRLDILVNNAGMLASDDLDRMDYAGVSAQFQVNAVGPLRVTNALRPNLKEGSKVVIVTSRMGSMADNNSGRMYGYRMSKAAVNMVGKGLSRDLAPLGVAVLLLHPGFVRTEMTGGRGNWNAEDAAQSMLARIKELQLGQSGAFWHADGTQLPW
jgi:NAD(P)-dependent dehydrogenase (short-subunit alcohol dehydrogenase family)